MRPRRIYEGDILVDDPELMGAAIALDDAVKLRWGWKRDDRGLWYREVEAGQDVMEPPRRDQTTPASAS